MEQYIPKSALVAEIESKFQKYWKKGEESDALQDGNAKYWGGVLSCLNEVKTLINALEAKEADLYNNGWIDCTKQMPQETKQTSDTLQGHREWTASDVVLAWDSSYGCRVDFTKNGKWVSEQRGACTGQLVHGIIAWRPIPEFSEELLLRAQIRAQKGEEV